MLEFGSNGLRGFCEFGCERTPLGLRYLAMLQAGTQLRFG
jgi:hypothetical protein